MADLWSDYADLLITNVDSQMGNKYKMSLRNLLTSPLKYAAQQGMELTISNMREDIDKYVESSRQEMKAEVGALEDSLSKAETITSQVSQSLSSLSKQNKVPLTKPAVVERDAAREERIYLDSVDSSTATLVEKLVNSSFFIADFSTTYRGHRIGEWFFSGPKNYNIRAYVPSNPVMLLETAASEVATLLDNAASLLKG